MEADWPGLYQYVQTQSTTEGSYFWSKFLETMQNEMKQVHLKHGQLRKCRIDILIGCRLLRAELHEGMNHI